MFLNYVLCALSWKESSTVEYNFVQVNGGKSEVWEEFLWKTTFSLFNSFQSGKEKKYDC
jgi:hypothetical protein